MTQVRQFLKKELAKIMQKDSKVNSFVSSQKIKVQRIFGQFLQQVSKQTFPENLKFNKRYYHFHMEVVDYRMKTKK